MVRQTSGAAEARSRRIAATWIFVGAVLPLVTSAAAVAQPRELRVCADPDNLPFSNERLEGFENKVAALIAKDLGAEVRYAWLPQRRGFIRRTLSARQCDIVMGVPSELEMVLPTKPYYTSTYVFVYRRAAKQRPVSFDDPALKNMRIGLHAIGDDGYNTPPAHALAKRGIVKNIVGFYPWDVESVKDPQGRVVDAVASGEIDVAIVWGPFGGFFAKNQEVPLEVVPVPARADGPYPFVYDISFGVRKSDKGLKEQVEAILDRRREEIRRILVDYGVPLVDAASVRPAAGERPSGPGE
jgi:mxaJ protein